MEAMLLPWITTFGLIFTRMSGWIFSTPVLSDPAIPLRIKIAIDLLLAIFLTSTMPTPVAYENWSHLGILAVGEFLLGSCMGLFAKILFSIFSSAGQLAGMQIGLGFAGFIDPSMQEETMVTTRLIQAIAGIAFVLGGGIHHILSALAYSIQEIPIGVFLLSNVKIKFLIEQVGSAFKSAVNLNLPILSVMLLMQGLLAIMTRSVSEFNLLFISFAFLLSVGLVVLVETIPDVIQQAYDLGSNLDQLLLQKVSAF